MFSTSTIECSCFSVVVCSSVVLCSGCLRLFSSKLPLGDTDSTSVTGAFVSFSSELPLGDTDSTKPSSPFFVSDFTSSAVSLVLFVPPSGSLDSFLVNFLRLM